MKAKLAAVAAIVVLQGCATQLVEDRLGGRHQQDNTLRCDVEVNGTCLQWGRTRSLRSVAQEG